MKKILVLYCLSFCFFSSETKSQPKVVVSSEIKKLHVTNDIDPEFDLKITNNSDFTLSVPSRPILTDYVLACKSHLGVETEYLSDRGSFSCSPTCNDVIGLETSYVEIKPNETITIRVKLLRDCYRSKGKYSIAFYFKKDLKLTSLDNYIISNSIKFKVI